MVNCPKCGKEVEEGVNFCPYCGAEISVDMNKVKIQLDELQHDIRIGWIIVGIGIVFMILSLAVSLITKTHEEWKGLNLYEVTTHPYANIAIFLVIIALILVVLGGIMAGYHGYKRDKLLKSKGLR
mgnify:CR=1 FL=1